MDKLLSIGKILNFHGIKGELKVAYTSGNESQLEQLKSVYVFRELNGKKDKTILSIKSIRFHKNIAIIKFKEINSIDEAAEYKGAVLKVEKSTLVKVLDENEYYIEDLVGMDAYTLEGEFVGKVKYVADQGNGNIIAIRDKDKNEHLVPFVKDLVPGVDMKNKKITINAIPGLIDKAADKEKEE